MPREYDIGGVRWFSEASREMARALHPLLAQVTREELAEGPPPQAEGAALPAEASSLYRPMAVRHDWTVSIEDVAAFNLDQFLTDLHALADSMGGQMVRGMLEHISAVTEEYGNTIDAEGPRLLSTRSPRPWRRWTSPSTRRVDPTSRSSCTPTRWRSCATSHQRPNKKRASTRSWSDERRSGLLRDVVGTFLDTLTEREFDGPLLALLHARGFTDIHFIHGAFEFGKDVLAKKTDPATGETRQYVIQSKAGDIGQPEWRAVRPQLEECEYNTIGHPSFDPDLPRVAVLVTTGRLKGAAPADVTEYRKSVEARGLADLEIWERPDLVEWLCDDPVVGVAGDEVQADLMGMLTSVRDGGITDRRIETYTRRWLPTDGHRPARVG